MINVDKFDDIYLKNKENLIEEVIDVRKKLQLCNQSIDTLNLEVEKNNKINESSVLSLIFVEILIIMIITLFWRIKSMKKNI